MDYEADAQGGAEVEDQLQRFQQSVDDLRQALQELTANPPKGSHERQQQIILVHRLRQELSPDAISRLVRRQEILQEQFTFLSAECEAQLLAVSKEQLLDRYARTQEQPQEEQGEQAAQQQRQQLVKLGDEVQDQTQISLARTQQLVAETEDMGATILQRMQQQNEQLEGVRDRLDDVEYNLARAKKTAQSIAKNAANDRCMQCLCCCFSLLLIASIVLIALPGR